MPQIQSFECTITTLCKSGFIFFTKFNCPKFFQLVIVEQSVPSSFRLVDCKNFNPNHPYSNSNNSSLIILSSLIRQKSRVSRWRNIPYFDYHCLLLFLVVLPTIDALPPSTASHSFFADTISLLIKSTVPFSPRVSSSSP